MLPPTQLGKGRSRIGHVTLPIVLGIFAAWLVLLRTATYGPGTMGDSVAYLSQLHAIGSGILPRGYITPPGYAAVLWLVHNVSGLSPIASARVVNAAAFGLTVFVTTFWCRSLSTSNWIVLWCGAVIILSPLSDLAAYFMTEALFVLLVTLAFFALDRFLRGHPWFLMLAVLAAAAACLTRLVGVAVIGAGALLLLIAGTGSWSARLRTSLSFAIGATTPFAAWLVLANWPFDSPPNYGYFDVRPSLSALANTFVEWTFGRAAARGPSLLYRWTEFPSPWLTLAAKFGVLVAFFAPALLLALRATQNATSGGVARVALIANGLFLVLYLLVLALMVWVHGVNPPARYFLPMYVPGLLALTIVLQSHWREVWHLVKSGFRRPVRRTFGLRFIAVAGVFLVIVTWQCLRLPTLIEQQIDLVKQHRTHGQGFAASQWRDSDTMTFARQNVLLGGTVYTNQANAVILNVDPHFERVVVRHVDGSSLLESPRSATTEVDNAYVVWFHQIPGRSGWPGGRIDSCEAQEFLESLLEAEILQLMAAFDDGIVFRVAEPATPTRVIRAAAGDQLVGQSRRILSVDGVDAYLAGRRIIYRLATSKGCPCGDLGFFLRVTPVNPADLSEWRSIHDHTDEYLDPLFNQPSRYVKAACAAVIPLPDFDIQSLETGSWIRDENGKWLATEWGVEVQLGQE